MKTPTEVTLLPCDKCGQDTHIRFRVSRDGDAEWLECPKCGRHGPVKLTRDEAIVAWNTRALSGEPHTAVQCVEAVARIIDPENMRRKDETMAGRNPGWAVEDVQHGCLIASDKAREILALLSPNSTPVKGGEA